MLVRPRMSRIFYGGKFYDYPLKATNALKNMGLFRAAACMASYAKARLRPIKEPKNFQEWVTNQFGAKLFNMFFKSYTEKVWGIPCTEIGADWAAQRIKGLSLGAAVKNALFGQKKDGKVYTTLIDQFRYPRLGPGQLWEVCAQTLKDKGWTILMNTKVTGLEVEDGRVTGVTTVDRAGQRKHLRASQVFSSMPLCELLRCLTPSAPAEVLQAADALKYRDFLTVALVIDAPDMFPDNWIYIHSPEVRVGRIQNFGNWSPEMVPEKGRSCVGLEYFVNEGDDLWSMSDADLVKLGHDELKRIGLATGPLVKGYAVRIPKAYPVYDPGYADRLQLIRNWLGATIGNLQCMGRNGQHRYNNQDHSMATALIAARNVVRAGSPRDPWAVNEDAEYHEIAETERQAPITPVPPPASTPESPSVGAEPTPRVIASPV
jgi:protoporphyrinogen oxidase